MMLMLHQICYLARVHETALSLHCEAGPEIVKFQQIVLKTDESGTEPLHKLQCSFKICEILWTPTSPLSWSRPVQTEQLFG